MWWDPCLSHEHPTSGHQGLQHPSDTLDIMWESPSQVLASCGKADTQETFPPAELRRVNAFACSEFPRIFMRSQVPNLSTDLLPLKKKKKILTPVLRRQEGKWAKSVNSAVHCCLRQELNTQAHTPKSPASPLTQELNLPAERLNSGELGSLVVCPHLQQRKLEEKAIEAPLHPETIFLLLPTLVFPVFYLERVDLNVMSPQPSYKEKNVSLKEQRTC